MPTARARTRIASGAPSPAHAVPSSHQWAVTAMLGAVAVAVIGFYLARYAPRDLNPVGWDVHAYIWQSKAVGAVPLSAVGPRPGLPLVASLLGSIVPIDAARQNVALGPVLGLMLGLAIAVAVRMAFRLPAWSIPAIGLIVAIWPSTQDGVYGYQASLMLQVVVAAGIAVLLHADGRPRGLVVAGVLFAGAALSHIVFYGLFGAVAGLALVLAVPAFLRDRRAGRPFLATEAGGTVAAVGGGGLVGAAALFGYLGFNPLETADVSRVASRFQERTWKAISYNRPRTLIPVGLVGAAAAWVGRRPRAAGALIRLGVAWMTVVGMGVLASVAGYPIPGGRMIQFALPIPAAIGLSAVAIAWILARGEGVWRRVAAAVLVLLFAYPAAAARLQSVVNGEFAERDGQIWEQLRAAGAYLEGLPGDRPVVFVVDGEPPGSAYRPKQKLYIVRGAVPRRFIPRTFVYMGTIENLESGRPTLYPETVQWQRDFNALSLQYWEDVEPALADGAVVLVARQHGVQAFADAVQRDPGRRIAPGLYAFRGPVVPTETPPPPAPFPATHGLLWAVVMVMVLGVVGWGWTRVGLGGARPTAADVMALSPAVGAGAVIIPTFALAVTGADPSGPAGLLLLVTVAVAGLAAARRWKSRTTSTAPAPPQSVGHDAGPSPDGGSSPDGSTSR